MNAEDVAHYLRAHPDFLNEHHELFTQLTVPHPQHGGQAISLAERQLHALRDKIRQLEVKLAELIRTGKLSYEDFTPIALLNQDPAAITVKADWRYLIASSGLANWADAGRVKAAADTAKSRVAGRFI